MKLEQWRGIAFVGVTGLLLTTTSTGRSTWLVAVAWALWGGVAALTALKVARSA